MRIRGTLTVNPEDTSPGVSGGCSSGVGVAIAGFADGGFNRGRFRGGGASWRVLVEGATVGGVDAEEGGVGNVSCCIIAVIMAVVVESCCRRDDRL